MRSKKGERRREAGLPIVSCKKCGAKISTEYSYCMNCGAPIVRTEQKDDGTKTSYIASSLGQHPDMNGHTILRESLAAYKNNPSLVGPVAVSTFATLAFSYVVGSVLPQLASISTSAPTLAEQSEIANLAFELMPYLFGYAFVNYLVTVGLVTMVGRIVTEQKCKLSDWVMGIKNYFWKILGVSIVIGLLFAIIEFGVEHSLLLQTPVALFVFVVSLMASMNQLVTYFCLAPIVVDNAGLQASITLGARTIRMSAWKFLTLFVAYFAVLVGRSVVENPKLFTGSQPLELSGLSDLQTALNAQSVVYPIFWSLLIPLWLLIIFTIHNSKRLEK